jgi:multiple sugar transport system permease protein
MTMACRCIRTLGFGLLVALAAAWSLLPIVWIVLSSFKPATLIFDLPPVVIFYPTLSNYVSVLTEWPRFISAYRNSIIITSTATLLTVGVTMLAAYALSRYRFPGRGVLASTLIVVRMLPPIVLIIPLFPLASAFGLLDTYTFMAILYATFAVSFTTWILKSYLDNMPKGQEEAALLDGCTRAQAFLWVVLPQMKPAVAAVAVYVSIGFWNEFLFGFVFSRERAVPAPVIIAEMLSAVEGLQWGDLFAATTMLVVPVLILTWLIQRQLIAGFTLEGGEH